MNEKKYDVTAFGEMLIDFVPCGNDEMGDICFARKAGGAPPNLLAAVSRFGGKAAFIGKVGKDMFGNFLRGVLKENGIEDKGLVSDDIHNTTLAFVALFPNGDRDFSFYRTFGADTFITKEEVDTDIIKSSKIFHFGSLAFTQQPCIEAANYALHTAKESGCIITYDANYRAPLWKCEADAVVAMRENLKYVDITKLSKEEIIMITGENDLHRAIDKICEYGVKLVLVTDGPFGVTFGYTGEYDFIPALEVKAIDTTGAGDIFFGTFLSCFIKDGADMSRLNMQKARMYVERAANVAGRSTLKHGAIASIPEFYE